MSITRVVAITGCDSGLGWAIAARSAREGLITVAGMYQGVDTKAAESLEKLCAHPYSLDVTNPESVTGFRDYVRCLLSDNPNYKLHAVVNNSGVMTIGDYEWQTTAMIENTINVNLLGAMRVVSAFLPDLRKSALESACSSKPRIINVASHCGLQPLPGFAAYSASKAGVIAWTKALRMEHLRHGLSAVAFVPGGFVTSSNIIAGQASHGHAMLKNLNDEQRSFYENRITSLTNYLEAATAHDARYDSLKDENIIETFVKALTDDNPKELYKVESWRYMFYYNLFKLPFPEAARGWLAKKFLNFPE
ncbi:SDR family oxidoreductase shroud [Anticarsia gemmatalis]|uniref:SDR family oxidoreductase shroud n=1 Tax=Anticarsia gemmatalis TaxID=129554 RepID=UPI003F7767F2